MPSNSKQIACYGVRISLHPRKWYVRQIPLGSSPCVINHSLGEKGKYPSANDIHINVCCSLVLVVMIKEHQVYYMHWLHLIWTNVHFCIFTLFALLLHRYQIHICTRGVSMCAIGFGWSHIFFIYALSVPSYVILLSELGNYRHSPWLQINYDNPQKPQRIMNHNTNGNQFESCNNQYRYTTSEEHHQNW